ncbi:hypothetical protein KAT92_06840, partial [Candidatus Babeliales bacterium]|nr:hypothetical protein [Candidatus Babeliales bacterium]
MSVKRCEDCRHFPQSKACKVCEHQSHWEATYAILEADNARLREALARLLEQHNDDCLLCAWKDTIALKALSEATT